MAAIDMLLIHLEVPHSAQEMSDNPKEQARHLWMEIVTTWCTFQVKGDNACIALGRSGFRSGRQGDDDACQKHRKREFEFHSVKKTEPAAR